ncbi:MAG TPA: response regulator [Candidatus Binatia bacterium]|nr:response regulator [Candidatus Binatia bacterium]
MSPRILLVDDDPDILTILGIRLTRAGFEVAVAMDGREGLAALRHSRPRAVVLDLLMPNLDGFEFLATVRNWPATPPVFVVTQADDGMVRQRVRSLGAAQLVSKGDALGREFAESLAQRLGDAEESGLPPSASLAVGLHPRPLPIDSLPSTQPTALSLTTLSA